MTEAWLDERRADRRRCSRRYTLNLRGNDGVTIETDTSGGSQAQTILAYAKDEDVDQIVMGSRGRDGAGGADLVSTAGVVVRRADVPVTVVA